MMAVFLAIGLLWNETKVRGLAVYGLRFEPGTFEYDSVVAATRLGRYVIVANLL